MQIRKTDRGGKFFIENGSLELLKWIALILMTVDHVNTYLFDGSHYILYSLGRIVMPIFVFVLVYNLTRPGVFEKNHYFKIIKQMIVFGLLSCPAFYILEGCVAQFDKNMPGVLMLNILFTLALLVWCLFCFERGEKERFWFRLGWVFFVVLGLFVQFWWGALGLGVSIWWYYKDKKIINNNFRVLFILVTLFLLWVVSLGNFSFLLVFPVIYLVSKIKIKLPRMKWFFYFYYPLHLTLISIIVHFK